MSKSNALRNTLIVVIVLLAGLAIYKATMMPADETSASMDLSSNTAPVAMPEPAAMIEKAQDAAEQAKEAIKDTAQDVKEGVEGAVDQMQQAAPTAAPETPQGKTE